MITGYAIEDEAKRQAQTRYCMRGHRGVFVKGYAAFYKDQPLEANPYDDGSAMNHSHIGVWSDGWKAAKGDHEAGH